MRFWHEKIFSNISNIFSHSFWQFMASPCYWPLTQTCKVALCLRGAHLLLEMRCAPLVETEIPTIQFLS